MFRGTNFGGWGLLQPGEGGIPGIGRGGPHAGHGLRAAGDPLQTPCLPPAAHLLTPYRPPTDFCAPHVLYNTP
eukprot:8343181-Pyramimonas_sp.AAC.1